MDASSYGRLVERGGYATGGTAGPAGFTFVGEHGPEIASAGGWCPDWTPRVTLTASGGLQFAETLGRLFADGQIRLPGEADPDDGTAGVPAKVG